jgi:ribosome biogenesis GTPase / thiamine phosphate phosphatase
MLPFSRVLRYNNDMTRETDFKKLQELGWDAFFEKEFTGLANADLIPVRVTGQEKYSFKVSGEPGEMEARLSGKMWHNGDSSDQHVAVGDWVAAAAPAAGHIVIIEAVLPRKSRFSRQAAGGRARLSGGVLEEQILAANLDTVFIVSALDSGRGLNLRRLERYLALTWESGAAPVIVLNKIDLCEDLSAVITEVEKVAMGVPVLTLSAATGAGIDLLKTHIPGSKTAAFLGPSGVGKSSIINALLGAEKLRVGEVRRDDSAGRHTTSSRQLFLLPDGGMVIDTPGIREIQLWTDQDALSDTFPDIRELSQQCRFKDCTHSAEPDCAVQKAVIDGILDADRLHSYEKLQKELHHLAARQQNRLRIEEKERGRKFFQMHKEIYKRKR